MMKPDPVLLLHSNIPRPLHSLNPRTLLGQDWWNTVRQEAYARHDFHCHACGIYKRKARYHPWLEGHEIYQIDYAAGRAEMVKVVALCHACHNFIHDERMQKLVEAGHPDVPLQKYLKILEHGNSILEAFLQTCPGWQVGDRWKHPFQLTQPFQRVFPQVQVPGLEPVSETFAPWSEWHLVLHGVKYPTPFQDEAHWQSHYAQENAKANITNAFKW